MTVSPMEHKRDATVAGLGWPSNSNRGTSSTKNDTEPGCQAFELSHPAAPAHSTSTTSAPPEANAIANDLGTTSQFDTYSAPTQPDVPFPTEQSFYLQCLPTLSLLIPSGPSDPIQDLYPLQQHQGVIH